MQPTPMIHALLRGAHVFDGLSEEEVDAFTRYLHERRLVAGDTLFFEGEPGHSLFVLLQGEVAVELRGPHGEALRVARLAAGDVLGEQSCIDPAPRSATVRATSRVLCLELPRAQLDRMAAERPRLASHLLGVIIQALTDRLRAVDRRIAATLDGSATPSSAPPPPARPSQPPSLEPPRPSAWERLRARFGGEP